MEAYENIMSRRSIRKFTDRHIDDETLYKILDAAMTAPSCACRRDWSFIVVRDRETLGRMADANGRPAEPLRGCDVGILICGDVEKAFAPAPDYWIIDSAIAGENMILAAHALGIGSVWLGTWPQMDRVENQKKLFGLPDTVIPHSIIAFGYPDDKGQDKKRGYEESCVHFEKW